MSGNEIAQKTFDMDLEQIKERLAAIEKYTDNHMGVAREEVNWSYVALTKKILSDLTSLTDYLMIPRH